MIEVELIDHMGSDLTVVNSARVSFGKKKETLDEKDTRLINYLGRHKHISPFGHCFASFHVSAPVYIARQLVKHKFLRWNEISRRYVDGEPALHRTEVWRSRPTNSKQGSGEALSPARQEEASQIIADTGAAALSGYSRLIGLGVAPEQARELLPGSLMTEWYWSGSLDAFADMCNLRCKQDTQQETRQVAEQIDKEMQRLYPHSWSALRHFE